MLTIASPPLAISITIIYGHWYGMVRYLYRLWYGPISVSNVDYRVYNISYLESGGVIGMSIYGPLFI
jgi:hypothetical protein